MLYEVITDPYAKKANNGEFAFYGHAFKEIPQGNLQGITNKETRITSYNVCYTKLLR